ncbi:FecCD family ABC transporter permease [Candidatus Zixiibacteriota bacterium]
MSREHLTSGRVLTWTAVLAVLLLVSLVVAGSVGAVRIPILRLFGFGESLEADDQLRFMRILLQVRLPRVLLAAILGGALTVAGIVFQALLRNPLADPYILGVSGGASLGGVTALLLGLGAGTGLMSWIGVPGFAFLGALVALVLIERIASHGGRFTVHTILLTGVIFNAFCAALIFFIQSIASLEQLHAIVFYLMGKVPDNLAYLPIGGFALVSSAVVLSLFAMARDYNAMAMGEEGAMQVGVDLERIKRRTFLLGSLLTGMAVSVAGLIGFVGLVVPHLLRIVLGPDHRLLIPTGFIGGATFLVLADLLARTLAAPNEIPVGVVTALVGGPFFLYLLRSKGRDYAFS